MSKLLVLLVVTSSIMHQYKEIPLLESLRQKKTRNSSGDEIANVNFIYDDIVHALGCTTQLRDVRGLPLPVRRSSKPVSCIILNKLFLFLRYQFLSGNPRISRRTL